MLVPGSANPLLASATTAVAGYQISRSLRFNSSDSAYLSRTPAAAGNRKTWTWSGWVKRSELGTRQHLFGADTSSPNNQTNIELDSDNTILITNVNAASVLNSLKTSAIYRDVSAWMHVVVAYDTTAATGANRVKLYVNGSEVTAFSSATYPAQNYDTHVNSTVVHSIGWNSPFSVYPFSGYLADIHFIDGQTLTPSSFGEFDANGEWQPKAYTGTYGTNGFKLNFADNSAATAAALGKDTSGNGNNWTPNNLSVTAGAGNDSLVDVPTNGTQTDTGVGGEVRGNYCTLNPLNLKANGALANGNLDWSTSAAYGHAVGTVGVSTGKWYCEFTVSAIGTGIGVGVTSPQTSASFLEGDALGIGYYSSNGSVYYSGGNAAYGTTFTTGDVIGVALDLDNGKLFFAKNGTWQNSGSPTTGTNAAKTGLSGTYTFGVNVITGAGSGVFNFGQRPFAYTAPSGFKALCTANLPAPVVTKPSTVMDVVLYTGTGSTLTPTSSLGFSPDLVWIKGRSGATDHALYDTVRGAQARLESNTTDAEVTTDGGVTAFNSNGFTLGTLAQVNTNTATYAAWCWDAGSSNVVNTQGSITSTVRANPSAGFSIVTYTGNGTNGATVGHGLGVSPSMVIVKSRSGAYEWPVYHSSLSAGNNLFLHLTNAQNSVSGTVTAGGVGGASSTTFTCTQGVSNINNTNATSATYVAYCFAPVAGYSAFGSYTGNGSADGPFVYTGFRPRWVMVKITSTYENWTIFDNRRSPDNLTDDFLLANASSGETANGNDNMDFLSNGFKLRGTNGMTNGSYNYIYAAFAENPFSISRAR